MWVKAIIAILAGLILVIAGLIFLRGDATDEALTVSEVLASTHSADNSTETHSASQLAYVVSQRDPQVPDLPFDDNPDPAACGIPELWGPNNNVAYLSGIYEGQLFQEEVLLYDSHSRLSIEARAPHGTQVEIIMFQRNPVLDYYKVRIPSAPQDANEGWIPGPFLSREPIEPL